LGKTINRIQPWEKQLTGDNLIKNKKTRRQPWVKTINRRQPGKKQEDKETTLGKNNGLGDNPLEQGQRKNLG
jgi:hypothetical protein